MHIKKRITEKEIKVRKLLKKLRAPRSLRMGSEWWSESQSCCAEANLPKEKTRLSFERIWQQRQGYEVTETNASEKTKQSNRYRTLTTRSTFQNSSARRAYLININLIMKWEKRIGHKATAISHKKNQNIWKCFGPLWTRKVDSAFPLGNQAITWALQSASKSINYQSSKSSNQVGRLRLLYFLGPFQIGIQ